MSEWKEYALGDIINIIGGGTPKRSVPEYWDGDIPWLSVKDFNKDGRYVRGSEEKITKLGLEKSSTKILKNGQIIISARGTIGALAQVFEPMAFNQSCYGLDAKPQFIINDYLFYVTKHSINGLKLISHGAVFDTITKDTFQHIQVTIPPLPEQKAIAHILGKLDDKIELNRQMNQTLEEMAQALFKSWFVDFDPVFDNLPAGQAGALPDVLRTKYEKRKLVPDEKKLIHKNPELAQLFPSQFTFNETLDKWIPEGWEVKTIGDVSTVVGGGTPSTKVEEYFCKDGISWLSPKDLSGYEWKYISKGAIDITELGLQKSSAKLMPKGSVLFSSRAPIGYMAIAENEISTNQGFKSLVPNKGIPTEYLFHFMKSNLALIDSVASGSTFKEVSGSALKGIEILIASNNIISRFSELLEPSNGKMLRCQKETETLTQLRDTLLPQLISGKVRVPTAFVEEMAEDGELEKEKLDE